MTKRYIVYVSACAGKSIEVEAESEEEAIAKIADGKRIFEERDFEYIYDAYEEE